MWVMEKWKRERCLIMFMNIDNKWSWILIVKYKVKYSILLSLLSHGDPRVRVVVDHVPPVRIFYYHYPIHYFFSTSALLLVHSYTSKRDRPSHPILQLFEILAILLPWGIWGKPRTKRLQLCKISFKIVWIDCIVRLLLLCFGDVSLEFQFDIRWCFHLVSYL